MLPYNFPSGSQLMMRALVAVIAAAAKQSASALRESEALIMRERNTGEMAHSRFAVQEIRLICNRNFV